MIRRSHWTEADKARLLKLRDDDQLDWSAIVVAMPGRTLAGCKIQYYGRLRDRCKAKRYSATRQLPPAPPRAAPVVAPAVTPAPVIKREARGASLDGLREWNELRARIAERGLTGGMFNDPAPGRSALDQRAGAAAAAVRCPLPRGGSDVG
ncbi:hypothetical protein IVB34_21795 [Bradyrhizobium sp. 2]|uniref:SANT/Myb-like DNA-binding domain-containing protein n=1 Tax=Bradyrhizobium sp. 2 TaxID=190045 RepID=UPI001FF8475D|nr:SANT/Myb-like DNA-binding domain-containing protein [Bradyrhizobium sp. 2]MCK1460921.1 hypothetical protein [Bradyrhizobium sp. 2]